MMTFIIVGIVVGGVLAGALAAGATLCWLRRRGRNLRRNLTKSVTIRDTQVKNWLLAELQAATHNFDPSHIIGAGGFGMVYKAELDGSPVAVKRLTVTTNPTESHDEFVKEVQIIGSIHHRNLISLRGYCIEGDEFLLVYDFMPNGSLEDCLFKKKAECPLTWQQRVDILIGIASGLAYMHGGCDMKIIHRDIKPANILLDSDFSPHVADFGLVRSTLVANSHVNTKVGGTFGYLDLGYAQTGNLTEKSDVYSFGVLLLVVIGNRPAVEDWGTEGPVAIVDRADQVAKEGRLLDLVAPSLLDECDKDQARRFIAIAFLCLQKAARQRPSMADVEQMLRGNLTTPSIDSIRNAPSYLHQISMFNDSHASSSGWLESPHVTN